MPSTAITDVRSVGVSVADQDRALDFYVDVLGFDKTMDAPISPTMRWIEVAPPGASTSLALTAADSGAKGPTDAGIRFTVHDATAEHATLRARGVRVGELLEWDGVPPMFPFDDPDGNRFYVVQDPS
jgi:lactoylglutathione lyase